jgi:hypothetical protein
MNTVFVSFSRALIQDYFDQRLRLLSPHPQHKKILKKPLVRPAGSAIFPHGQNIAALAESR